MNSNIQKSFGTVLRDHPQVKAISNKFQTASTYKNFKQLPKIFDGRQVWRAYLTGIRDQKNCGNCWAQSVAGMLSDRFAIQSLNQIHIFLSAYEMTICESVLTQTPYYDPNSESQANLSAHTSKACSGNTIYSSLNFTYSYGTVNYTCISQKYLIEKGIIVEGEYRTPTDIPDCSTIIGKRYDTCLDDRTAVRFYRSVGSYNIDNNELAIKQDIYRFGPCVSGFIVFENFLSGYDGKTVYTGPPPNSTSQGGHAIKIIGWGEELINNELIKYWWIENSWGPNWGLGGYFKMKIGIKECKLEENMAGCIPDIYGMKIAVPSTTYIQDQDAIQARADFKLDAKTGYTYSAIEKIKNGELEGSLEPLVNVSMLPDFSQISAGEVPTYPPIRRHLKITHKDGINEGLETKHVVILLLSLSVLTVLISYHLFKKKK